VKELLEQYPNLIYSRYDWGNGDFEEAIEGAGHVGNKEIAQWLIEKGARPNLFVMTMLGETAIVKSVIEKSSVKPDIKIKNPATGNDVFLSDISRTGGEVNAYEAVKLASTLKTENKKVEKVKTKSKVVPKKNG
jgi:hypothetical protein